MRILLNNEEKGIEIMEFGLARLNWITQKTDDKMKTKKFLIECCKNRNDSIGYIIADQQAVKTLYIKGYIYGGSGKNLYFPDMLSVKRYLKKEDYVCHKANNDLLTWLIE